VFRDKSASSVPVGQLYSEVYHTVVVAPATSNTVQVRYGFSDTLLPTCSRAGSWANRASSLRVTPSLCVTQLPHDWVTLRPRRIDSTTWSACVLSTSARWCVRPTSWKQCFTARLQHLSLKWEHIVFLNGHLAKTSLERVLAGIGSAPFTWEVRDIGVQVAR